MRLFLFSALALAVQSSICYATSVSIPTTSGLLQGSEANGLLTFKGIRFGKPPTGSLRWEPPSPFTSTAPQNATSLGPSCVQQFPFAVATINQELFNTPPPPEDEDCLFLNVWAPASINQPLPVVIWIYGGALAFGTASIAEYDGASLASNESIVVVSFNYRTNVFGFPESPDLPLAGNNLGFLDQELAFQWVQQNIAQFGGDPTRVTIMGQSGWCCIGSSRLRPPCAGHSTFPRGYNAIRSGRIGVSHPVFCVVQRHGLLASDARKAPGAARLACLKNVSASAIRNFTNSPSSGVWGSLVDNVTVFADPLQRIRTGQTARVPFVIGHTQDDGSLFAFNQSDLATYLAANFGTLVTPDQVRALYASGLSDNAVIAEVVKDFLFLCPAELWGAAAVSAGITNVYRYAYGAVFGDLQLFPNAGAWHSSELREIFGTFNATTATASERKLSQTMQTLVASFIKSPTTAPAPDWPEYVPGNTTTTLAKLAYDGNVALGNVVQAAGSSSLDSPCDALWNKFLDVRV
ncbi:Alpha/Beta hydrolase protein [Mycena polygramma]|nr:Alpha/Beta hydrolase protein [Mycena polygramma]